jgi:cob(I)alamin adenosyltransferase
MSFTIDKVYTKTGDEGKTGLVGGQRVAKTDARIAALGSIDETNSALGLAKEYLDDSTKHLAEVIEILQQELFDIGAEVATPTSVQKSGGWRTGSEQINNLEKLCDKLGEGLPELTSFILPGGSKLAAQIHIARSICRRAEIKVLDLKHQQDLNQNVVIYLNRLSDVLFNLARRVLNKQGKQPNLWKKFDQRKWSIF